MRAAFDIEYLENKEEELCLSFVVDEIGTASRVDASKAKKSKNDGEVESVAAIGREFLALAISVAGFRSNAPALEL
jgi:hypothetical protein